MAGEDLTTDNKEVHVLICGQNFTIVEAKACGIAFQLWPAAKAYVTVIFHVHVIFTWNLC